MTLFLTMNSADTLLQVRGYGHYGEQLTGDFAFSRWLHPLLQRLERPLARWSSNGPAGGSAYPRHSRFSQLFAFLQTPPYPACLPQCLLRPTCPRREAEEHARRAARSALRYGPLIGAVAARRREWPPNTAFWREGRFRSYLAKPPGLCSLHGMRALLGSLPRQHDRKSPLAPQDHDEYPRPARRGRSEHRCQRKFTDDGKNTADYISVEELRACTTCNACVEECPVSISPLEIHCRDAPGADYGRQ